MMETCKKKLFTAALAFVCAACAVAANTVEEKQDLFRSLFGELKLVDEINCATDADHEFMDEPAGVSKVETILGRPCRVLPNVGASKYFSYIIGKGKGLKAGKMYVLTVEYPEDKPRAFTISNKGNETNLGVATGVTFGDALVSKYVGSNPELVEYPLTGKFETTKAMFNLHDRTAADAAALKRHDKDSRRTRKDADGFSVAIAQFGASGDPLSAGAAVSRIALYEVVDPSAARAAINYPPAELPKRHIFWREEMGDSMVSGLDDAPERGILKATDYYKYKYNLMRFLAINTFCKDMLEFGHNQGWDSTPYGGGAWYNQTKFPERWEEILEMLAAQEKGVFVLPYYEYAGSIGHDKNVAIGSQCRAINVNGEKKYTHISWSGAPKCNADLADPDFIVDANRLLDATQTEFKDKVTFIGAWFRPRMEGNPISFAQKSIDRFNKESGKNVNREQLAKDQKLQDEYVKWFLLKRREWMLAQRDFLRKNVSKDAAVLYTVDPSEPGKSLPGGKLIVADNLKLWKDGLKSPAVKAGLKAENKKKAGEVRAFQLRKTDSVAKISSSNLTKPWPSWGKWRWDLACPYADPQDIKDDDGLNFGYSFSRLYTVAHPEGLGAFHGKGGMFMARHYSLNENNMQNKKDKEILGYYCAQFDRAREHGMLAEARALINGDPRFLGYLAPMNMGRLFPEYVRAFNQAFLALPAVPSAIVKGAASDPNVGVREYKTDKYGTYYAVANLGLNGVKAVKVKLPASGKVTNLVTGTEIPVSDGEIALDFYSGQVYALNVK